MLEARELALFYFGHVSQIKHTASTHTHAHTHALMMSSEPPPSPHTHTGVRLISIQYYFQSYLAQFLMMSGPDMEWANGYSQTVKVGQNSFRVWWQMLATVMYTAHTECPCHSQGHVHA